MIEAKLLVGRYLDFTPGASRHLPSATHTSNFVNVNCPPLTIKESVRQNPGSRYNPLRKVGGQRVSSVIAGTNLGKVHRNFKWLPWYGGDISETVLNCDVLTGPMSGCILVSYRRNGVSMVGHIGTVTLSAAIPATVNTNVKAVWTNFATTHQADVIGGFNPFDNTIPAHPPAQPGDGVGQIWGLITRTGFFYAVQVYVQTFLPRPYRIAAVYPMQSMTLNQLQNI